MLASVMMLARVMVLACVLVFACVMVLARVMELTYFIVLGIIMSPLRGSHGLSAHRALMTKSRGFS